MIVDYINAHMGGFWIMVGFILLASEVLLFGFTTIVLLFAGLGALVTGLLIMIGVLPETWLAGISSFGVVTGVSSILLWKPLKRMQDKSTPRSGQSSDLIGLEFIINQDITSTSPGQHRYSGMTWRVEPDASANISLLRAGQRVAVVSLEAGLFRVKPVKE